MKKIAIALTVSLLSIFFTGCESEIKRGGKSAELSFNLTSEGEFTEPDPVETKAGETADVNEFSLVIKDSEGKTVGSYPRYADMPKIITLDPGTYNVTANSPGNMDVAWSQPIFSGTKDFTIEAGAVENVNLVCTITNMKVTVRCTEKFFAEMSNFTVSVSNSFGVLNFTRAIVEAGTSGFFKVAPLTLDIKAERKTGGDISHHVEITNVAAKDHHVFTIDASETGYADLTDGISIDYTVNNKEENILIDGITEDPVVDDVAPEVKSTTVQNNATGVDPGLTKVDFTYQVPVKLAEGAAITLNSETVTATVNGKILSVGLGTLAEETQYTITIPAGAVLNSENEKPTAEATVLSFVTGSTVVAVPITITSPGIDAPATFPAGTTPDSFVLSVAAEKGIANFNVVVKSASLIEMLEGVGQTDNVDLANMDAGQTEFWGGLFGITSDDVKGSTSTEIAIQGFIGLIPVGDHNLEITIVDNDGNRLTKTINIIITAA